jgi:hypothetical protein
MNFEFAFLGQSILKYTVPLEVFVGLNELYETKKKHLPYTMGINSIWVNEMKAGDYNPVHIHQGKIFTGLSSVMILKLPKDYGPELTHPEQPMNGQLQILGNIAGQFAHTDYSPEVKIGDFYIFPYDMRHVVYPFTNKKAKRRTLVCNMDVAYNPVHSRTVQ